MTLATVRSLLIRTVVKATVAVRAAVLLSLYPFEWAHERTHYAAARPWRLPSSEIQTRTLTPAAHIEYDLCETPRWAVRLVGLAPTIAGYLIIFPVSVFVILFAPDHYALSVKELAVLIYLAIGWIAYTTPSRHDLYIDC